MGNKGYYITLEEHEQLSETDEALPQPKRAKDFNMYSEDNYYDNDDEEE